MTDLNMDAGATVTKDNHTHGPLSTDQPDRFLPLTSPVIG